MLFDLSSFELPAFCVAKVFFPVLVKKIKKRLEEGLKSTFCCRIYSFFNLFLKGMIAFVRGKFVQKTPSRVLVDVQGVGYELQISLHTYSAISQQNEGLIHTYLHITENAHTLYGFHQPEEKEMFLHLISVSGVGASTARMMLSGMEPREIATAIVSGNTRQLESIKGIGKKSAERLIVELKDKLGKHFSSSTQPVSGVLYSVEADAVTALVALGIGRVMAEQAVKKTRTAQSGELPLEELIKLSLKSL
jgi:Holliday junction DNA helicase RuvA